MYARIGAAARVASACAVACVALLLTACSDELFDLSGNGSANSGIQFRTVTREMGREVVNMGSTRGGDSVAGTPDAATVGTPDEGDRFVERLLQGDNTFGLKVQRQPVPLMGFNRGAVKANAAAEPAVGEQSQGALSRAGANEVVTDITNFHDSLTIWGYTSGAAINDNADDVTLFNQILLTKVRNWRNSVEWPYNQGEYMRFYAVAPSLESVNVSATGASYSTPPQLTYTLPEESNELIDLLYGESENISIASGPAGSITTNPEQENLGKDNKFVDLQFRHITTAVRFSQGTIPTNVTINSITISGSRVVGTYNPAATDATTATEGAWTFASDATRPYIVSANHTGTGAAGSTDVPITGTPTLFLLPQTLDEATLTVNLTATIDGVTKPHTLTCSLAGDVWKKGYTVDYRITIGRMASGYYLSTSVTDLELEHSTNAVSGTLGVNSYRLYYDYTAGTGVASYSPVTWNVAGYSETGATNSYVVPASKPSSLSWITDFRGVLNQDNNYNGGNGATATYTLAAQSMKYSASHSEVLTANAIGSPGTIDLSTHYPYYDGANIATHSYGPANCYIVNRTGTYQFPLVYGNMTADNDKQLECFKDHQGNTIKKYKIKDQIRANTATNETRTNGEYVWSRSGNADKGLEGTLRAVLLWQDKEDFINSNSVSVVENSGNAGVIQFTVGKSAPANAAIALQARKVLAYDDWTSSSVHTYGDWETLWTWHIWMTDEVYRNEGTSDAHSYDGFYVNGSTTKTGEGKYVKADHVVQLKNSSDDDTDKILPVNLGWVPDNDAFGLYEPREVWVKLKQTGQENTVEVHIKQHARQALYTGTGTVYQWGRPTAFPALHKINGDLRKVYDINNNEVTSDFVLAQTTDGSDAVSRPFGVLQCNDNANSWFNVASNDYANAMWNSTTKTVYDPCPPGYRVPPASVFYGFSKKTGSNGSEKTIVHGTGVDEAGKMNMWPDGEDLNGVTQTNGALSKGAYFFCKANETDRYGKMVYMPATGEWHGNKTVGTELSLTTEQLNQPVGLFWTSDYYKTTDDSKSKACMLWITPDYSFSTGTEDKPAMGFFDSEGHKANYYNSLRAIRPMQMP